MKFNEQLNYYINKIDCSSKELANSSNLSPAVISRYRNGERIPSLNSDQISKLVKGIYNIAEQKNIKNITEDEIFSLFIKSLNYNSINFEHFREKLNEIILILSINVTKMARKLNFDASYISKIRNGKRTPTNINEFIDSICEFIALQYNTINDIKTISILIKSSEEELSNSETYISKLKTWFTSSEQKKDSNIQNFLKKLDEFNLNEYIKVIHFDELKVPSIPFFKATNKTYYGIEEMKHGELDFFKSTVLSKSTEPIFMYNDMPLNDMAEDIEFNKKWMFAIAITLKKGLHLNIIHNLNRPFNELLLGLEGWIPIYMTGQISPYYLKGIQSNTFCHFNYVSGKTALSGECIQGFHNSGKYYLTTNSTEVDYYKNKSKNLLSKALPLMEIYRQTNINAFHSFILSNSKINVPRRRILSTLPLHTISQKLLLKILKRNNISKNNVESILKHVEQQKELFKQLLHNTTFTDEFLTLSKENFEKDPQRLFLAECFYEDKIIYNYKEYLEHLNETKEFEKNNKNYFLKEIFENPFKNIQITIQKGKNIIISKNTDPAIHFVINHPTLRDAIEKFVPPIIDTEK